MKTITKRLVSTLLCLVMAFPTAVFAEDETHSHDEITVTEEDLSVENHSSAETEITVTTETVTLSGTETPDPITEIEVTEETTSATSGTIGESNISWVFDPTTGHLTITGTGDCATFTSADDQPWAHLREQITEVWFSEMEMLAITDVSYWFDGCTALVQAEIPYTTSVIGERAFANCPALETVLIYYTEQSFTIEPAAFLTEEPKPLELRYIPGAENTFVTLSAYDWKADNRFAAYTDVYGFMDLASALCYNCDATYRYTLEYEQWNSTYHCVRWWCSNCGKDMNQGTNTSRHTMSNGVCTLCGYDDGTGVCTHDDTSKKWYGCDWEEYCDDCGEYIGSGLTHNIPYTEWDGCNWRDYCSDCHEQLDSGTTHSSTYTERSQCSWYEYCNRCNQLMDSGAEHGEYTYREWEYYSTTRHRRLYGCSVCGTGTFDYENHSTSTKYSQYSNTLHQKGGYCSLCSSYVGSTSYEDHSFTYGAWSNYDGTQHQRTKTCSVCGYSTVEYEYHLCYGVDGWVYSTPTEHKRTEKCDCGYNRTYSLPHSYTTTKTSASDTTHRLVNTCNDCGHTTTSSEAHSFTYGAWMQYDDTQHTRTKNCDCGYSGSEFAEHSDTDDDGYCDNCGQLLTRFSVTVPAVLDLTVSKDGKVYAATTAQIVNNSTGAVSVTSVQLNTENDWQLVPYSTNMADAKVDAKLIGFYLNGVGSDGSHVLPLSRNWQIAKNNALDLDYDAVVSATSDPIDEQVLTVVFVLDWA